MERDGLGGFELVVVAFAGVVLVALITVWSGATLSLVVSGEAGRIPFAAAAEAAPRLPRHFGDPAAAWPEPHDVHLPAAPIYWLSTALTLVVVLTTVVAGLWWLGRRRVGTSKRRPLGVDARPRFAKRRDLAALLLSGPAPGRFVIATFGRRLVATETPPPRSSKSSRRRTKRRGD
ncbi:MAG: hypothetical protein M9906_16690, partial [Microthrixaceae bacterium]|nr:hypothetical protein [Microthrixaceae bacterium]